MSPTRSSVSLLSFVALVALAAGTGCGGGGAHAHHWTYAGAEGPEHWGDLDPSFALCKTGTKQSPIDLPANPRVDAAAAPQIRYSPVPLSIVNEGHTIKVNASAKVNDSATSSVVLDGATYELEQFHVHSPSEHAIAGKSFDAEMHLVHTSKGGRHLVIALLFTKGKENATLKPVWDAMPSAPSNEDTRVPGVVVDVAALFPTEPRFARYDGSLTTPPCAEGITWLVVLPEASSALELSGDQLARFRAATQGATNRPRQQLNGRGVVETRAVLLR